MLSIIKGIFTFERRIVKKKKFFFFVIFFFFTVYYKNPLVKKIKLIDEIKKRN